MTMELGRRRFIKEYTPSCDIVCPVQARVFGDIDDPNSEVSRRIKEGNAVQLKKQFKGSPGPVDPRECYECHRLKSNPPVLYAPRQ